MCNVFFPSEYIRCTYVLFFFGIYVLFCAENTIRRRNGIFNTITNWGEEQGFSSEGETDFSHFSAVLITKSFFIFNTVKNS